MEQEVTEWNSCAILILRCIVTKADDSKYILRVITFCETDDWPLIQENRGLPEPLAKPLPSAVCMFLPVHLFAFNASRSQAWRRLAPEWKAKTWAGKNILHQV
ncbi:MAG: hypothetical protein ACKVY0_11620 [Prosthecobacter sp.]|uniref:hypothetical protein n=1 Tax=Prosthecobacter sp. TaxID=1965333 RepID=UPI0038FF6AEC